MMAVEYSKMEENIMHIDRFAIQCVSGREREIFLGVLEGYTNQEIAGHLRFVRRRWRSI